MSDYYLDELMLVLDAYSDMHKIDKDAGKQVYANDF